MKFHRLIILSVIWIAACGPVRAAPTLPPSSGQSAAEPDLSGIPLLAPNTGDNTKMEPLATLPPADNLEKMIQNATQDIVQKFSAAPEQVIVVEAREVTWSNSGLGCPQPDMAYAEVLTPGYLVKLSYNDIEFEYHAGPDGALFRCKNPIPPVDAAPINT